MASINVYGVFWAGGPRSQVTNSWRFACICGRHLQRCFRNRKIDNQLGIAKGRTSTNQSPDRTTVNETPGRHHSRQITGTISTQETANLQHFRNNSWSSHLWRCLPQMQVKCQEFVTWDYDPPARKTPYTERNLLPLRNGEQTPKEHSSM